MINNELREARNTLSDLLWNHKSAGGDEKTEQGLQAAVDFLTQYLEIKGFPEEFSEEELNKCFENQGCDTCSEGQGQCQKELVNETIETCKIAVLKILDKVPVRFLFSVLFVGLILLSGCSTPSKSVALEQEDRFHRKMNGVFDALSWEKVSDTA